MNRWICAADLREHKKISGSEEGYHLALLASGSATTPRGRVLERLMGWGMIPAEVIWAYLAFGVVIAVGVVTIFLRGDWQKTQGLDKLILFGPIFYAAPLAGFATEHFTRTIGMTSLIPKWIPGHLFWVYLVGACFLAAAFSLVTGIQARLAASLLALAFFLFVALMYFPGWLRHPENRIVLTIALRETSFSGGALALAATLSGDSRNRRRAILATIAR